MTVNNKTQMILNLGNKNKVITLRPCYVFLLSNIQQPPVRCVLSRRAFSSSNYRLY